MATDSKAKVEQEHGTVKGRAQSQAPKAQQAPSHADEHGATAHHSHRQRYFRVFGALVVLTLLELGVVKAGLARSTIIGMLILLAVTKAGAVALFFMHLSDERRALRLMIGLPLLVPPIYAIVLIIEAFARATFTALKLG